MENKPLNVQEIAMQKPTVWINPYYVPFETVDGISQLVFSDEDIKDAEARLQRFAPFIEKAFPETKKEKGIIESPLVELDSMKKRLQEQCGRKLFGKLLLKMDSHLAIAGSVKARGGIYEVLKHAEDLALKNGKITLGDDYSRFASEEMRNFLSNYTVQVGSTGNLGMSIGIISAKLGFKVKVHMSVDAKQWKKDLLRSKGVEVLEYETDYSKAVEEGRNNSAKDPTSYFVDDEKSKDLFLGYAVAGKRLQKQLTDKGITVDENHPLIVYIPAGVGGAPGGISYGLKRIYKDNVHCFFVEPTLYPSVLLGIATQQFEKADVRKYGLDGLTAADGLACPNPSGLVTRIMTNHLSGVFTVKDGELYQYLRLLNDSETIQIEPSACAAFAGVCGFASFEPIKEYCKNHGLTEAVLNNATQIAWATGGSLVPKDVMQEYLQTEINL